MFQKTLLLGTNVPTVTLISFVIRNEHLTLTANFNRLTRHVTMLEPGPKRNFNNKVDMHLPSLIESVFVPLLMKINS